MRKKKYTDRFFDANAGSGKAAETIVALVARLISPASVIDIGCGRGGFLSEFLRRGVTDILGVDGSWINPVRLRIPEKNFVSADLEKPFSPGRKFDLAVSLEVAEHLRPESAETFVGTLAGCADAVLFSAAVPFQGGRNHFNEQWPGYWAGLFAERGFSCFDVLREKLWDDSNIPFWYSQNMLLYARGGITGRFPGLGAAAESPMALVHPGLYLKKCRRRFF